jgi:vacuolar-type H+-ATPase subunit F/Vma7
LYQRSETCIVAPCIERDELNSCVVGDVSVVTDIIIAGIPTLHAPTIGEKAAKSNKVLRDKLHFESITEEISERTAKRIAERTFERTIRFRC